MRKQGEFYLKLISILLAVVIAAYVLFSVVLNSGSSYALETAVYCEVGDGLTVSGFVVRSEEVLVSDARVVVPEKAEGERVASGERVATGYESHDARESREELASLRRQREQLAMALIGGNAAALDDEIAALLVTLSARTARQNLPELREAEADLVPLILRRNAAGGDDSLLRSRLTEIDERIATLSAQTVGATAITVDRAGYFSEAADGYEGILTPEALVTMGLSTLRQLSDTSRAPTTPANAIGRLIAGQKWYFVTEIPAERAALCTVGRRLTVNWADPALQGLKMRIERVGEEENGACLLVLSCERYLHRVTKLRLQSADLIFTTYEGLRVPKQAIYHIDGETGVYILENSRAAWKEIELLCEYGEDYLVRWDSADTDNLWPKDELILTSEEIKDGMVMK